MAEHYTVNDQIVDSVANTTGSVLGSAPAQTAGMLEALMTETLGMAMYNAVTAQHNSQMVTTAAVTAACARMLKVQGPPMQVIKPTQPTILAIRPSPVPPSTDTQMVEVAGIGFQNGLTVQVLDAAGKLLGTLMGARQVMDVFPTSFSIVTNLFATEADYSIVATNPDGSATPRFPVSVVAPPPMVNSVEAAASPANTYVVAGSGFQSGLTIQVTDQRLNPIAGTVVPPVTPTSFSMTITPPADSAIFSVLATNPDGRKSQLLMFTT